MSTNYYLINKKQQRINNQLNKLITKEIEKLKNKLLTFNDKYDLEIDEEIEDKIRTISVALDYGICESEQIHICKTSYILTWQVNQYYSNVTEFISFYNTNKDKYYIENEYNEKFTLKEFLKEIIWNNQEIRYETREFC